MQMYKNQQAIEADERGVEVVTEIGGQGRKVAGAINTQAAAMRTWSR